MGSLVVGRDGSCDVVLDDSSVSRWHVKIDVDEQGACRLTDLGSTNGTYVFRDQEPVGVLEALVTLTDRVKIGKCEFAVRDLLSQSRGRRKWAEDGTMMKSTESLWRTVGENNPGQAPGYWRPTSAFIFVVGFSIVFWLAVLYFLFDF